jgi:putative transposase
MSNEVFILTDKCEFVLDEELKEVLEFNMHASAYVYNKTLEYKMEKRQTSHQQTRITSKSNIKETSTEKSKKQPLKRKTADGMFA